MNEEVVARTLADDAEVVHEGVRKLAIDKGAAEPLLCDAGPPVLVARGKADPRDSLRLGVELHHEPVAVDGEMEQIVQVAAQLDELTHSAIRAGYENQQVDRETDVAVGYYGRRGVRPWHIGIRHPRAPGVFASVEIETDESILTSGDYERFFIYNRKRYHHVIDPRTGYPIRKAVCATVIHRSAAIGDATATALLVAGPDHWEALAQAMGIEQAMLVDAAGNIHVTSELRERIRFHVDPGRSIFTSADP